MPETKESRQSFLDSVENKRGKFKKKGFQSENASKQTRELLKKRRRREREEYINNSINNNYENKEQRLSDSTTVSLKPYYLKSQYLKPPQLQPPHLQLPKSPQLPDLPHIPSSASSCSYSSYSSSQSRPVAMSRMSLTLIPARSESEISGR